MATYIGAHRLCLIQEMTFLNSKGILFKMMASSGKKEDSYFLLFEEGGANIEINQNLLRSDLSFKTLPFQDTKRALLKLVEGDKSTYLSTASYIKG